MTPQVSHSSSSAHTGGRRTVPRRTSRLRIMLLATSALASAALPTTMVHAVDATWNPVVDNNFNDNGNWTDAAGGASVVPDGAATFNASNTRDIQVTLPTTLGGITVTSGAGDYAFTTNQVGLTFNGAGLSVGSGAILTLNVN